MASWGRTRAPALCSTTHRPDPKRSFFASSGTSATTSRVIASPRAATAARAAFPARVSHGPGRLATPLSRTKPSSRFRSRAATARVAAAKTTGTRSRGTAQSVRRMASSADETAIVVERSLDVRGRDSLAAGLDREEDRDRVGRVQAHEGARDLERVGRPRGRVESVARDEAGAPLGHVDPVHPVLLST